MARYLLLIYGDENQWASMSPEDTGRMLQEYSTYGNELTSAGAMVAGEGLQPTATATTVTLKGSDVVTTDGPYAETKEQLGGFYLVEARDLDDAIQWAAKIPSAKRGGLIEVRPVQEFPDALEQH